MCDRCCARIFRGVEDLPARNGGSLPVPARTWITRLVSGVSHEFVLSLPWPQGELEQSQSGRRPLVLGVHTLPGRCRQGHKGWPMACTCPGGTALPGLACPIASASRSAPFAPARSRIPSGAAFRSAGTRTKAERSCSRGSAVLGGPLRCRRDRGRPDGVGRIRACPRRLSAHPALNGPTSSSLAVHYVQCRMRWSPSVRSASRIARHLPIPSAQALPRP